MIYFERVGEYGSFVRGLSSLGDTPRLRFLKFRDAVLTLHQLQYQLQDMILGAAVVRKVVG